MRSSSWGSSADRAAGSIRAASFAKRHTGSEPAARVTGPTDDTQGPMCDISEYS